MADTSDRVEAIERMLREALAPDHLSLLDESHRHRGHAGAASGGGHFRVTVVSDRFAGRSRLERHRLTYAALGDWMGTEIHALSVEAFTPAEWARREE